MSLLEVLNSVREAPKIEDDGNRISVYFPYKDEHYISVSPHPVDLEHLDVKFSPKNSLSLQEYMKDPQNIRKLRKAEYDFEFLSKVPSLGSIIGKINTELVPFFQFFMPTQIDEKGKLRGEYFDVRFPIPEHKPVVSSPIKKPVCKWIRELIEDDIMMKETIYQDQELVRVLKASGFYNTVLKSLEETPLYFGLRRFEK